MTQTERAEVLERAIQEAFARGWEFDNLDKWQIEVAKKTDTVVNNWWQFIFSYADETVTIDAERIIFDHDFAKALWPNHDWKSRNDGLCGSCGDGFGYVAQTGFPCWKEHLQQMVIADDPIGYLAANLPKNEKESG